MGCVYRRVRWTCKTCKKRRDKITERKACQEAGHDVEQRQSPVWWISYRRAGKEYSESVKSPTCDGTRKKDALALLRDREGDIGRGKPITPQLGKLTFEDASADVLKDYKTTGKKSHDMVERRLRLHLEPYFGGWRMANITTPDVRKYVDKRQTELSVLVRKARTRRLKDGTTEHITEKRRAASNGAINRELALLKRMFTLAIQGGKLLHKPYIPMLRESPPRSGFFESEQLVSVLAHLPVEVRPVIEFAAITGWRIASVVLPLQWHQVDLPAGEVRLNAGTTKNREGRVFPMTVELRRVLNAQHAEHLRLAAGGTICPWVFTRGADRIVSFKKAWKEAVKKAGCPGRIPHDLRRTAVRNLVRAGISEQVAMSMTGHKTRSVFMRYDIVSGEDLRDAARKLDVAGTHRG